MKSEQAPGPAGQDRQQILPELDDAVARLPELDSRLILLRFYQGLSHQEAAALIRDFAGRRAAQSEPCYRKTLLAYFNIFLCALTRRL